MPAGYKKTEREIKEIINSLGYELLDQYIFDYGSYSRKVIVIQDKNGFKARGPFEGLIASKKGLRLFDKSNPYTLENISLWLKLNNKNFELCKDNIYKGNNKKLKFYHPVCNEIFYIKLSDLFQGNGCGICAGYQVGKYNNLEYLMPNLAKEWVESKNHKLPSEVTKGSHEDVYWECSTCKHRWWANVNNRSTGTGCPKCNESKGERKISDFLFRNNISFISEFTFEHCKYKRKLPFDFYLPDYNLIIEYYGFQHYEPVNFSGKGIEWAEKNLLNIQSRDAIKENYCHNNNIPLLIIPYTELNQIENILINELSL